MASSAQSRLFNHAELVHAPGERELVKRFFEALGCGVMERGGPSLVVLLYRRRETLSAEAWSELRE